MKHLTANRSNPVMKYFTPELFARFNSPDDEEADRADEDWESAIQAYRQHLEELRNRMPAQVEKLASLCLHDAEILAADHPFVPSIGFPQEPYMTWTGFSILSVRQDREIVSLIYLLWDSVRKYPSPDDWPFSKIRLHWLYDELDVYSYKRGAFFHRVLFSNGSITVIPFCAAMIHSIPLPENLKSDAPRNIA